ncbi:site-specific DNA-methyltransferase [Vibrio parahaemolyticus]|uniref:site-specific DNA-methyltransferase n=1 Tax=Vibrio owensii TaxID=696485 RepID=UPI002A05227D|nr:site-specific DNA-methyltransferase [Vibrio parahaemolyticus]
MNINEETVYSNVETANSKQLAILKKHFPNCFDRNGNFIQERMLEVVNDSEIELSKESYALNWLGKSYSRLLGNLPPKTLIHADVEHNAQEQHKDSKNLLIKGDNLEVLKHLVNAYSEKVKMIYIDPPYNTGSDGFVYNDDRKFTKEQLAELAGLEIDEAERILSFADKGTSSHSAWLTFMYPRLYVAKELLTDDGVIFISIDDSEASQLAILCDEIFGEHNFIAKYIHKNNSIKNQAKLVSVSTEYIYCFAKNKQSLSQSEWRLNKKGAKDIGKLFQKLLQQGVSLEEIELEIKEMYKRPKYSHLSRWNKVDSKGVFKDADLSRQGGAKNYTIVNPTTGLDCVIPERGWGKSKEELERLANEDLIWYGDPTTPPGMKDYINTEDKVVPDNFFYFDNSVDTRWVKKVFGELVFENPKPIEMIKQLVEMVGLSSNELVMDFFAGSGTTAHAIYQLNAEDGKERRFISVQLDEHTEPGKPAYESGYHSIFDIIKARITHAAKAIKLDTPDYNGDLGFKIFETVEDFRVAGDEKELELANLTMFDDVLLTDEQYQTLLTTWALYDGSDLTTPIYDIDLDGYTAHLCDRRLYMIAPDFSSNALKALLHKLDDTDDKDFAPNKIVYYANNFDSVKQMELNEALKSYANKKSIEIDVVVRN